MPRAGAAPWRRGPGALRLFWGRAALHPQSGLAKQGAPDPMRLPEALPRSPTHHFRLHPIGQNWVTWPPGAVRAVPLPRSPLRG